LNTGRRDHEGLKLERLSRYDFKLELIFKFLLVFKVSFLMQYECMMPCNMPVLYIPHKKKKMVPIIDGVRVVGDKSHSSP
jgi:hypothetical protein